MEEQIQDDMYTISSPQSYLSAIPYLSLKKRNVSALSKYLKYLTMSTEKATVRLGVTYFKEACFPHNLITVNLLRVLSLIKNTNRM